MGKQKGPDKRGRRLDPHWVRRLKMWGSAILLFAFATQQFFLVHYIGKLDEYFKGYQAYSNAYNSSLIYENLYFSQAMVTGQADINVLRKAAVDNISGFSIQILASELSKNEKKQKIANLMKSVENIKDFDSYNDYKRLLNIEEDQFRKRTENSYSELNRLKDIASWVYMLTYFVGSIFLIWTIKYE